MEFAREDEDGLAIDVEGGVVPVGYGLARFRYIMQLSMRAGRPTIVQDLSSYLISGHSFDLRPALTGGQIASSKTATLSPGSP